MIRAREEAISPEELIERMHQEHIRDFKAFHIEFDNYYSTHSPENKTLSELIYNRSLQKGAIHQKQIEQAYCPSCSMFLPDRYIRGSCPECNAPDQYGDSCDSCGAHYQPTELVDAKCANCGDKPITKESKHYFFRLADFEPQLRKLAKQGYVQQSVSNKLNEWFQQGLRDWDISRDGPYFGFKIPGEENKYFYVWLDAPIGYMASCKNYCDQKQIDFEKVWNGDDYELYHFIGKDIMYFHALFWPAMLMASGFKTAKKLFIHGFLTVNGQKMSKSKGTFIKAETYLKHLDPEYLRYYYASKLNDDIGDIDLNLEDFILKVNSDLVGKFANLASRSGPMINKKLNSKLGTLDEEGKDLVDTLKQVKASVIADYETLNYSSAIRKITNLADQCNRYVDKKQPWVTIKTDPEETRTTLTAVINAVKIITVYLKPVLPVYAQKVEQFLNVDPLGFDDVETVMQNCKINKFNRLIERVDKENIEKMVEESAKNQAQENQQTQPQLKEPIQEQCSFEDFMKVDLRIAKVAKASAVEGADKLLSLELEIGPVKKNVFAGISKAYKPEELVGKLVVCVANLKPRKMKFGVSEGMILAAGPGGSDIFMLKVDDGAKPGQRVH
jgi:methionyl-tRNA synthetase